MLNAYQLQQTAIAPRWMQDPYGIAWLRAMGANKDFLVDLAKQAVKCRIPGLGPLDALALIGAERGIFQAPGESTEAWAQRVIGAWGFWRLAGSAWGILNQLALRGYATANMVYPNGQIFGPSSGVDIDTPPGVTQDLPWSMTGVDGQAGPQLGEPDLFGAFWNRALLLFTTPPASWTNIVNPPTTATAPTSTEISIIQQILARWGAGHAAKIGIAVLIGTVDGAARACYDYPARTYSSQAGMTYDGATGQTGDVVFLA